MAEIYGPPSELSNCGAGAELFAACYIVVAKPREPDRCCSARGRFGLQV